MNKILVLLTMAVLFMGCPGEIPQQGTTPTNPKYDYTQSSKAYSNGGDFVLKVTKKFTFEPEQTFEGYYYIGEEKQDNKVLFSHTVVFSEKDDQLNVTMSKRDLKSQIISSTEFKMTVPWAEQMLSNEKFRYTSTVASTGSKEFKIQLIVKDKQITKCSIGTLVLKNPISNSK